MTYVILSLRQSPFAGGASKRDSGGATRRPILKEVTLMDNVLEILQAVSTALLVFERLFKIWKEYKRWRMEVRKR